jgi:hypothetical protein
VESESPSPPQSSANHQIARATPVVSVKATTHVNIFQLTDSIMRYNHSVWVEKQALSIDFGKYSAYPMIIIQKKAGG